MPTDKVAGVLPPPFAVSPLIKLCRWSLLLVGILYGRTRHKQLTKRETDARANREMSKKIRDQRLQIEREAASIRDIEDITKMILGKET